MQFKDLQLQYKVLKSEIDAEVANVIKEAEFISGKQVKDLEQKLAEYVGTKYCISCGNGTDALSLALMVWNIGTGDAVFVPDFTFFATGEAVTYAGATPVFIDINPNTYNIDTEKLEQRIIEVKKNGKILPKVIIAVDLFGQPADYMEIRRIADKYHMFVLEDGAQGFGGEISGKKACSFGDISTTSFFPAKPLGCYGDGGAIFTDNDEWANLLFSLRIHGKGEDKYDNIRIGMNSRLDTIQAAILLPKLAAFAEYEFNKVNSIANHYSKLLGKTVKIPDILPNYRSSWAQYTIQVTDRSERTKLQEYLRLCDIPTMIYYTKPMHKQKAFEQISDDENNFEVTNRLCDTVLSIPIHPYLSNEEIDYVSEKIVNFFS